MRSFVLGVHLFITLCMVGLILIQQTDKSGFGASGSGDPSGGFFTARPRSTPLSRLTAIFAALFMGMSLLSAYLAHTDYQQRSLIARGSTPEPIAASQSLSSKTLDDLV